MKIQFIVCGWWYDEFDGKKGMTDFIDGLMTVKNYETKIASIPNLIATFEVQKDITTDPVQTFVNLNEGKYEGLFILIIF